MQNEPNRTVELSPALVGVRRRPRFRGTFHQASFFVALGACAMLIAQQSGARAVIGDAVYSVGLAGMFGISALYHRLDWTYGPRSWMRRLDHSAIFVLIAGTGTPVCLLALPEPAGRTLLMLTWIGAAAGIIKCIFWTSAPKWLSSAFYVALGWLCVPFIPEILRRLGPTNLALLVLGGLAYTIGAVVYATKRPNPNPAVFGYHEIFHVLVMMGAFFHFMVIARL